jgi:hypothetical protein
MSLASLSRCGPRCTVAMRQLGAKTTFMAIKQAHCGRQVCITSPVFSVLQSSSGARGQPPRGQINLQQQVGQQETRLLWLLCSLGPAAAATPVRPLSEPVCW